MYREKPVSINTFLENKLYLNLKGKVRPKIKELLNEIFNGNYSEAVIAGAIGIGKSFLSAVAITYMLYKLGCLKDPQEYFGFSPDDSIYVMNMSTSEEHAKNIIFSAIKARIDNCQWFRNRMPYDPTITSELRFPNSIYLIPGNSSETFFEGYNIFGGIIDEADAHVRTPEKDFAKEGYNAIKARVKSRFGEQGLVMVIGSPKVVDGFLMSRIKEGAKEKKTFVEVIPYWTCPNPHTNKYGGKTFHFKGLDIPIEHKDEFDRDPERSMRDIAAIPSYAIEPFFAFPDRIEEACNKEMENPTIDDKTFQDWFVAPDDKPRVVHIDLGINKKGGDNCGIAMGYVTGFSEFEGENSPTMRIDLIMRLTAPPQGEILISDVRQYIYELIRRGFNIKYVSYDGFASEESIQQLKRKGIMSEVISVDKDTKAYESLKDAIYQNRLEFYEHRPFIDEAKALELRNGEKVDHQPNGSKDCSDAVAGVVYRLSTHPPKIFSVLPKVLFGVKRKFYGIIK